MGSQAKFNPVTHVIYDMDGLILDTEPLYFKAIDNVCQKYGSHYTIDAKLKTMGRILREGAAIAIKECNLQNCTVEQYLEDLDKQVELFRGVRFLPGVERLVKHLNSHGIPQAVATSSKKFSFDIKMDGEDKQEFLKLFEHLFLASEEPEVKHGKPHPDTFLVAAKRFKQPPTDMKNVLVFEDSPNGALSGLNAGAQVVWIPEECVAKVDDNGLEKRTLMLKSMEDFKPELFGLPPF